MQSSFTPSPFLAPCLLLLAAFPVAFAAENPKVDFEKHVKPILESACVKCHGVQRWTGDVRVDEKDLAFGVGANGRIITPEKPLQSTLYTTSAAEDSDPLAMPPRDRGRISNLQLRVLHDWIQQGAAWPESAVLQRVDKVEPSQIGSILQINCRKCHSGENPAAGVRLDANMKLFEDRGAQTLVVPFEPNQSRLLLSLKKPSVHDKNWPRFLEDSDIATLKTWIEQGALWSDDSEQQAIKIQPR